MMSPFSSRHDKESGHWRISFLNSAWSVTLDYWPETRAFHWYAGTQEAYGEYYQIGIWRLVFDFSKHAAYTRHLMAILSMMGQGDNRKWKGPGEKCYEDWDRQYEYGLIRQEQRYIRSTEIRLAELRKRPQANEREIDQCETQIEHRAGTIDYILDVRKERYET